MDEQRVREIAKDEIEKVAANQTAKVAKELQRFISNSCRFQVDQQPLEQL